MSEAPQKYRWVETKPFKAYRRNKGDMESSRFIKRTTSLSGLCLLLSTVVFFFNEVGAMFFISLAALGLIVPVQSLLSNHMSTPSELKSTTYTRDCNSIYSPVVDLQDCTVVRFDKETDGDDLFWYLEVIANNRRLLIGFENEQDASIVHAMLRKGKVDRHNP